MDKELISVIVAVYNVDKYLDKCVQSIVDQTYKKLEIILVDDGSTDNSSQICDKWMKQDSRIHVIHKKNGGLSEARNFGLKASQGQWICFVDGDDYIDLSMYETLYGNRIENGMAVCGYYLVNERSVQPCKPPELRELTSKKAAEFYLSNEFISLRNGSPTYFGSYAWNKIYDRSLFTEISYPKGKKFEDMYIILELLKNSKNIRFVPYCGYYYIQRTNSITHSFKTIQTDSLEARKKQKVEFLKFWEISNRSIDQLIAIEYFSILRQYALLSDGKMKEFKEMRTAAWENLKKIGYADFTPKMKVKLILCLKAPKIYRLLYKVHSKNIN
ncbi:glycosyltransferase [uncultured Dialister sp.]|jgi:glycosyltransferase involved in cell wall biosynthesis|uniref:glycosyltransferase family 2 protein n=1 Tax=uncultured Dialister sp. TaxID=278064 RepID=UPI002592504E|nr:glycosyltransferase [uncultured Dialister sp.]